MRSGNVRVCVGDLMRGTFEWWYTAYSVAGFGPEGVVRDRLYSTPGLEDYQVARRRRIVLGIS